MLRYDFIVYHESKEIKQIQSVKCERNVGERNSCNSTEDRGKVENRRRITGVKIVRK